MTILTAVATFGGLTLILTALLIGANRALSVFEDPRIDAVDDMLPHANCGACGYPGCRPFAAALVGGDAAPALCTVGALEDRERIAAYLGVDVGEQIKIVARLACAGGTNVARNRAIYGGLESCGAAAQVGGGGKGCAWGCLGLADCEVACDFEAITMSAYHLPVVDEDLCTACGDCVEACPKDLFSLHAADHRLWVACKNLEFGDSILQECEVGCTACGRCAMDATAGLVTMNNNLPVVDYSLAHTTRVPIERCPTGAIVWIDKEAGPMRGKGAAKVVRRSNLSALPS